MKNAMHHNSGARPSVIFSGESIGSGRVPPKKEYGAIPTTTTTTGHRNHIPKERSDRVLSGVMPLLSRNHTDNFVMGIKRLFASGTSYKRPAETESERDRQEMAQAETPHPVSWLALFSYSTFVERIWMSLGLLFAGMAGLCLPTWLILLAKALDTFSDIARILLAPGDGTGEQAWDLLNSELNKLIVSFAVLGAISLIVGFVYVSIWTYTGQRQSLRIKEKFVKSCLRQDAEWFDLNNREKLPTSIANAMVHIDSAVGRSMADLFANGVSSTACLLVAFAMNTYLALVMLCILPVVTLVIAIISCFTRKQSRQGSESFVSAGALATETISGIKTVASLCAEQWALTNYTNHIKSAQKHSIFGGILTGLMTGITGLLFYATYSVAFTVGTEQVSLSLQAPHLVGCIASSFGLDADALIEKLYSVADAGNTLTDNAGLGGDTAAGNGTIVDMLLETLAPSMAPTAERDPPIDCAVNGATVMCCIYGVILCATFFGLMAPGLTNINLGQQAAAQIFATINRIPIIDADADFGEELDALQGTIEFQNVFFAYPSHITKPIFRQFQLKIEPGSSVAFCGPSGSGKSTIAKLLLRFYCPQAGDVLIDGYPLGTLSLSWWRKQVGYVAQNPILFPGTLRYNIACGKEASTDADVIEAAKAACAHDFIMALPEGYDTFYSGASIQLSGGQMQRICIARAMIRKPSILLLDEATSALDTNSERQVQDALAHIRSKKRMTTLSVAHRLSTIVHCDQIAVISDGVIAELGNHKELFAVNGIYASLCESQGITADSTFDSTVVPETPTSKDSDVEMTLGEKEQPDIENGLVKVVKQEEVDEEDLEELLASPWRIFMMNKPEWGYLFIGILGAMVSGALAPIEAIFTAEIVDNFYTTDPDELMEKNKPLIFSFLILGAAALVGNLISGWGFSVSGYRLSARLRSLVFEAIVRRSIGWFDVPEHSVGELTSRLESDAEEVAKITGWSLGYRIRVFSSLIAGVAIALAFSWQIGLATICCVPIIMASSTVQKCCLKRSLQAQEGLSPESIFENGLRGIDAVQSYGLQNDVGEDYAQALLPQAKKHAKLGLTAGLAYGLSQFAMFGSFAVVFYVGVELLISGKVNFVEFFTPILSVMFGALGISQVNADFNAQQAGLAAAYRIFEIVDEPLDDLDPFSSGGVEPSDLNGAIEFKDCTFAYPTRPNNPIYYSSDEHTGFSINIKPKESVAFVGPSGSGKSTGLQILLRFYDYGEGKVLLDGTDLRNVSIPWLRRQIGYVGQMPTLFAGTIKDNILLGNPKASQEEIIASCVAANAHDFIMKQSDGYDTQVGNGGNLLSGGQKQRIAIARAIVNPNIKMLVLDEATAALDNESEKIVQAALDNVQKTHPRTTLMVAHRLSTVRNCNQIAVLGNGGVRELGTHDVLLEKRGLYRELWDKQGS